jgi:hypothetical protein
MEAPTGRRTRWRLRAGSFVLLAIVGSVLFVPAAPVYAEPGEGEETTAPPTDMPTTDTPTVAPTTEEPPTQAPTTEVPPPPPPPPTTEAPPPPPTPVHRFKMTVSTVGVGEQYWQGDGAAELVISIKNTGEHVGKDTVTGFYAFPSGAQATGAYGTGGCTVANGSLSFSCVLPEQALGQIVVKVNVDPAAWKVIGLGQVTAAIGAVQRVAPIAFTFTTPPTPGLDLSATAPQLPAAPSPTDETASLSVRLRNTGTAKGFGAVELVTPPGVDIVSFPPVCKTHKRLTDVRDRCELGDIAAGKEVAGVFGLTVSAAARADLPLGLTVHGYLTPINQDTIETRADTKLSAPPLAGNEATLPTSAPASPPPVPTIETDLSLKRQANEDGSMSGLPIIGGIVGLVALVGVIVVFSLRRRAGDDRRDREDLSDDGFEDVVLVAATKAGEEARMADVPSPRPAPPRPAAPRQLALPRLPEGPVAGSGFRERPRLDQDADGDD